MVVYSGDSGQTQKRFSDDKPYETEEAERQRETVWEMRGVEREREREGFCKREGIRNHEASKVK
jgi:hypothetical protein